MTIPPTSARSLVVALVLLSTRAASSQPIFKSVAGLGVVDNTLEAIRSSVAPGFLRFVNDGIATTIFPSVSVPFGIPGVLESTFSMSVGSIGLVEDSSDIGLDVNPGDDDLSVRAGATLGGVSGILQDFTVGLDLRVFGQPLSCGVQIDAGANLPPVGFGVLSAVDPSTNIATIVADSIQLQFPQFFLGLVVMNGDCASMDTTVRDSLLQVFTTEVNNFLASVSSTANLAIAGIQSNFLNAFQPIQIPLPPPLEFDVIPGRTLVIAPQLTGFRASTVPVTNIAADATSLFSARLSQPSHREGSSYANGDIATSELPDPNTDQLINFHLSADGLNSLFMPSWYLMWSTIATDPDAVTSALCQPIPTDVCPFPPVRQATSTFTSVLLLLTTFLNFGPMLDWNFEFVSNPPRIDFTEGNLVTGRAFGSVLVKARPLFGDTMKEVALVDMATSIGARLPDYDSATGVFSNFGLDSDFRIESASIGGLFGSFAEMVLQGPLSSLLNFAFDLSALNGVMNDALRKIPFKVPDIPLPLFGVTLQTEFEDAFAESVPLENDSFLRFGSNFRVRATPETVESVSTPKSVFDTLAYTNAISRSATSSENTTYTTMVYDPRTGTSEAFVIRRNPDTGAVEQLTDGNWVIMM